MMKLQGYNLKQNMVMSLHWLDLPVNKCHV